MVCHRDEAGRYQMTRCYTGTFDGGIQQINRRQPRRFKEGISRPCMFRATRFLLKSSLETTRIFL